MGIFGHMGITLAAGMLTRGTLIKSPASKTGGRETGLSSLTLLKNSFDYRVLLIGSLLPDLIDKPLGGIIFYSIFQNGRIFAHTLCFNLFIAALGIYVLKRWRKTWLLVLSFGSIIHLILDRMWTNPQTLLWPAYGWSFARLDSIGLLEWTSRMLHVMTTDPMAYMPEVIGVSILAWFAAKLIQKKQVYAFIRSGVTV